MTNWTKETDVTSGYKSDGGVDILTTGGVVITSESGVELVKEGFDTNWGGVVDVDSDYELIDTIIFLATEGEEDFILSEGELEYLMYSSGTEWSEVENQVTNYSEVLDA